MESIDSTTEATAEQQRLRTTRRLANFSLLLGLLAFPCCGVAFTGLPAVILAGLALERLSELAEPPRVLRRRAWAGMILGWLGILIGVTLLIWAYIAQPPLIN